MKLSMFVTSDCYQYNSQEKDLLQYDHLHEELMHIQTLSIWYLSKQIVNIYTYVGRDN